MQITFYTIALGLFVAQGTRVCRRLPSNPLTLFSRQSLSPSDIPAACQSTCAPIISTINSCQAITCLCNNAVAEEIADCANCFLAVGGSSSSLFQQEQSLINQYENACSTSGEPISSIQISSRPVALSSGGSALSSAVSGALSSTGTNAAAASATSSGSSSGTRMARGGTLVAVVLAGAVVLFAAAV
ncbi:hypothetical protein DFH11DRAFT_1612601 [Phellopilus nigrolimitatus]|nr:hypothetical protein DFH11DRAFT_1612601 [Phellopilus nigrolimitatus]